VKLTPFFENENHDITWISESDESRADEVTVPAVLARLFVVKIHDNRSMVHEGVG
jgi:hypothetical protein